MDNHKEWLESLKEGDKVAVRHIRFSIKYSIRKIDRITPTRRIKIGGVQYDSSGREMGKKDAWSGRSELVPVTTEIREKIEKEQLLGKLIHEANFKECSLNQLRQIHSILFE